VRVAVKAYFPAILCALGPAFCYLLIRPYAEIGIVDDGAFIKMVQVLAQSGHIVYNGAEGPILGWQLYLGALFVKLFGFSFSAVRLSILPLGMATGFLLQRIFVRAGINQWNAALASLVFIMSPLCLPLIFIFMSDVPGVLCLVVCLYLCLRAVQSGRSHTTATWLCLAALSNAVGGTVRQIAWLGVLVMVPSTVWLVRKRRGALLAGGLSCGVGAGFVFYAMHWYNQQPYSMPEPLSPGSLDLNLLKNLGFAAIRGIGEVLLLLLPILLLFTRALRPFNRGKIALASISCVCLMLTGFVVSNRGLLGSLFVPFRANDVARPAFSWLAEHMFSASNGSSHFDILHAGIRQVAAIATGAGLIGLLIVLRRKAPGTPSTQEAKKSVSPRSLAVILGPFTIAYICMLVPRSSKGMLYDRYLLPLAFIALIPLTLLYERRVRQRLPMTCIFLLAIFSGYGIADAHDQFSLYRGYVKAIEEIRSAGIPATAIMGPPEFDEWNQIEKTGYVNDFRIRIPEGAYAPVSLPALPDNCATDFWEWTPAIKPLYGVSLDPNACNGQAQFSPVVYRTWRPPFTASIYIVKYPAESAK
jgi:hypothetical protein